MKKWMLALLIMAAVGSVGFVAVEAYSLSTNDSPTWNNDSYYGPGMMGGGCLYDGDETTAPDYDYLYLHLSADDKTTMDLLYAQKLAEYDFSSMTTEEQAQTIETIKTELAQYIIDNNLVSNWYVSTD
ncbi:MAG: hypothetical protein JXL85_08335 [Bacilli bacterium]|nr:hypothetical protein [Bacilli bacterium]